MAKEEMTKTNAYDSIPFGIFLFGSRVRVWMRVVYAENV